MVKFLLPEATIALEAATRLLSVAAVSIASAVLVLGWLGGIDAIVRLYPDLPGMVPGTALGIIIAGLGVHSLQRGLVRRGLAAAGLLGVVIVAGNLHLFDPAGMSENDGMAPVTSICLVGLACSIAVRASSSKAALPLGIMADLVSGYLGVTACLTHLFESSALSTAAGFGAMSIPTSFCIVFLNIALILLNRSFPPLRGLLGHSKESFYLRAFTLFSIIFIVALCYVLLIISRFHWMNIEFRVALIASWVVSLIVLSSFFVGYLIDRLLFKRAKIHALERSARDLAHSERLLSEKIDGMNALSRIAAGLAHDLNNQLASLRGNIELIAIDPSNSAQYVEEAIAATERAAKVTAKLVAAGQRDHLNLNSMCVLPPLAQIVDGFASYVPSNIRVVRDLPDAGFGKLRLDVAALDRALRHVLANAVDAMPDGGEVRISAISEDLDTDGASRFNRGLGLAPGKYVIISIQDNGAGMDASVLRMVSQPYFTTKALGSGLGLAAVGGFCMQLRGGLRIESEPGSGTTVSIALPIQAKGSELAGMSAVPVPCRNEGCTVLDSAGYRKKLRIPDSEPVRPNLSAREVSLGGRREPLWSA